MRTAIILRSAVLALSVAGVTAQAQGVSRGVTLKPATTITKLQVFRQPRISGDNTAAAATVALPNLYAFMNGIPGSPKASVTLFNVAWVDEGANGKPQIDLAGGGEIRFVVGNAPAGYYHVRFDGAPAAGTTLEIHLGQNASSPVVATCPLSGGTGCDVVVSNPGGTVWLAAIVTSGRFQFWDVYVAPTARPPLP